MAGHLHPYDSEHPQLRGVVLGPGSKPIERGSWQRELVDGELSALGRLRRARRLVHRRREAAAGRQQRRIV